MRPSTTLVLATLIVACSSPSTRRGPASGVHDFDRLSRQAILAYANALDATANARKAQAPNSPASLSVDRWAEGARRRLLTNFALASASCAAGEAGCANAPVRDWAALVAHARAHGTANGDATVLGLARDQVQLAAVFPRTTSEILPLAPNEVLGDEGFADREFLLTFDDGPSVHGPDTTSQMIQVLRDHGANGVFFVLGRSLEERDWAGGSPAELYLRSGMCVGSHGLAHERHPRNNYWQQSLPAVTRIHREKSLPLRLFRPPYGQRTPEMLAALNAQGARDVLWNVDSRDWELAVTSPSAAAERAKQGMYVWRRGIILFHDANSEPGGADRTGSVTALGELLEDPDLGGVRWTDCRSWNPR